MEIKVSPQIAPVSGPITAELDDRGGAHVSMSLSIGTVKRLIHEETYTGALTTQFPLPPGKYDCSVRVSAFRTESLNATYASQMKINGQVVATADGSVPKDRDSDHDFQFFTLTVTA